MFYYAILTDIEGTHSYCGCLLFYEPVVSKKTRPGSTRQSSSSTDQQLAIVEEDEDGHSQMTYYVPKCLCLVTRQKHLDTIKVTKLHYLNCRFALAFMAHLYLFIIRGCNYLSTSLSLSRNNELLLDPGLRRGFMDPGPGLNTISKAY